MTQETKVLIGVGIATVAIITIGAFSFGGATNNQKNESGAEVVSTENQKLLVQKDSHKKVAKKEKVVVVEFGDFQCPACGAAYPIVDQILTEYGENVTFVFRQYPLPMHKNAEIAALAAEAAGDQGKFFEMYDALYVNQADWSESDKPMEYFEKYAKNLKLDIDKFKKAVENKEHLDKIEKDKNDGNALSVSATPTFFINGEHIVGGLQYDEFKEKIETAINNSSTK